MKTVNYDSKGRVVQARRKDLVARNGLKMWQAQLFILASLITSIAVCLGGM